MEIGEETWNPLQRMLYTLQRCAKCGEEKLPNIQFTAHHFSDWGVKAQYIQKMFVI
jgi:hypothetical protein